VTYFEWPLHGFLEALFNFVLPTNITPPHLGGFQENFAH
jgi:hypothetical protein